MRIWAVLPVLAAFSAFAAFYDDFEDSDMSGWQPVWGSATWSESDGCINGSTSNSPRGLAPVGGESSLDCVIQTEVEGVHAFGVIFRRIGNNGICAYVSPDADVARIRLITGGELGSELASLGASFPSAPYLLSVTCSGSSVTFHIECPSTGGNWTLQGTDPAPLAGQYGLFMGDEDGAHWQMFSVDGGGPPPASSLLSAMTVDDDQAGESSGNGNTAFEPAETIELAVTIHNTGTGPLENAYAVLQSLDYQVIVTDNYEEFGTIPVGGYATCVDDFGLSTGGSTPWDVYGLRLTVFADGGGMLQTDFGIPVGCGLACDVESGYSAWTASSITAGWGNNWHVSTARNHTTGGVRSFKCGDTGPGDYDDHLYCSEASPWFNVPLGGELSFWMWTDAQIYSTDASLALDGGLIQLGQFGSWTTVVPGGGYPHEIAAGTTGPYLAGTGVYSGIYGWQHVVMSVPPVLSGPQQLRFVFGSDNGGTREGWYIDDISVTSPTGVGDDPPSAAIEPLSAAAAPNPSSDAVLISLAGSISGDVTIDVFDLVGRKVIELTAAPSQGGFAALWNGRDGSGTIVPAGVYVARCSASDGQIRTLRLVRTR